MKPDELIHRAAPSMPSFAGALPAVLLFPVLTVLLAPLEARCGSVAALHEPPRPHVSDRFFEEGAIPTLRIQIGVAELKALEKKPRDYVQCTIQAGREEYHKVALRLKGSPDTFRPIDDKPSFTLNLDLFNEGQKFHGLDKIHLNNSIQDQSLLREAIASELFLATGIPTARTSHARVVLNGRELGLYVLKEGYDKTFLKRHFKKHQGNFYDGGDGTDVTEKLERDSGEGPADWKDLEALVAGAKESDPSRRHSRLAELLDMERFIRHLAMETIAWHGNGYGMGASNYRVYFDPLSGKAILIPHGMDEAFSNPNGPLMPAMKGVLARSVMDTPEGKVQFQVQLRQLASRFLDGPALCRRVDQLQIRMKPVLVAIDPDLARAHEAQAQRLKSDIQQRVDWLLEQMLALNLSRTK